METPDYIEIRIRCDGWWRKALIGVLVFVTFVGGCSDVLKSLGV
jgi:hypothetical protein